MNFLLASIMKPLEKVRVFNINLFVDESMKKGIKWEEYEENNLNELGDKYDDLVSLVEKEKTGNFGSYFQ